MDVNRQLAVALVLDEEGAASRTDRGLYTVWGVDRESLASELGREVALSELETLDKELATRILSRRWDELQLDAYHTGLDYLVFDCCICCGRAVTFQWLSIALCGAFFDERTSYVDVTAAARACSKERALGLALQLIAMRRRRAKMHVDWRHWRNVWTNRTNRVERRMVAMMEGAKHAKANGVGTNHGAGSAADTADDWRS